MKMKTLLLAWLPLTVFILAGCGRNADNSTDTNLKPATGETPSTNATAPAAASGNNTIVPASTNMPAPTNL